MTTETPSPAPGYLGAIDDCRNGTVTGWAVTRFGDECTVTVEVNGRVFQGESSLPRADLAAKGQARGRGGFAIAVGTALHPGENSVAARFPDGEPLSGSPRTVTIAAQPLAEASPTRSAGYIGAIDQVSERSISGWALTAHGDPCAVTIQIDDEPPVTLMAHEARPDLAAKGMSTGAGGWRLSLAGLLEPGEHSIAVTLPNGQPLPGSPARFDQPGADAPAAGDEPAPVATPAAPAETPPSANVAEFPNRPRPTIPSLTELDELSLDDLTLAVASGMIKVETPPEEQTKTAEPEQTAEAPAPRPDPVPPRPRGFFGRLFGR